MNVINLFWAFIAFILGLVITLSTYPVVASLLETVTLDANVELIVNAGATVFYLVLLFLFPLATALSDDNVLKKALGFGSKE